MRRIWGTSILRQLWVGQAGVARAEAQQVGKTAETALGRVRRFTSYYANANRAAELPRDPARQVGGTASHALSQLLASSTSRWECTGASLG